MTAVNRVIGSLARTPRSEAGGRKRFAIIGSRGFPSTYGGYETLVRYLARYMVAQGHEVTVYCRAPHEGQREWMTEGVRCVVTRGRDTKNISTLAFGASSSVHAVREDYDAVLVLNIANGFWLPLLRAGRVPFAVNTDGIEWERGKWSATGKRVFKAGAKMTARFAPELICDSAALGEIWEREFGRSSNFIPYGADVHPTLGDDRIREVGLTSSEYVLAVARLVPENNVELLLDAIDVLGDDAPTAVIVGSANFDNPITGRLTQMEAAGRVRWLGHLDDQMLLAELWQNAGAYVHGHSVGGTNPALLQALGAGAPTLALDTVFNREVLPFDDQLFSRDAATLAERITEVMGSATRRAEMAQRGRDAVSGRYSWDDVCARYTSLLLELAAARAARA